MDFKSLIQMAESSRQRVNTSRTQLCSNCHKIHKTGNTTEKIILGAD